MLARSSLLAFLASSISLTALSSAGAVEGQDVANRFKEMIARQGATASWASIDEEDGAIVLRGVTVKAAGDGADAAIGDVTFEGVEETDDGDYVVETLSMPTYSTVSEGATVTLEGLSLSGAVLPSPTATDVISQSGFFDSLDVDQIKVEKDGKQVFSMSGLNYSLERDEDSKSYEFTGTADAFTADMTASGDPQTTAMLTALGLAQPKGTFEMAGSWSLADGNLSVEQMDFTVENAGTIGFTFDISGYTEEFLKAAQDMQKNMANATEEQKAAAGMAAMGLMQQLSFAGASIRYDDEALAGRALDLAAGMQKMQRTDMVKMAQMMIPVALGQYVKPEFANQVAGEVAKFMQDPKSLEIKAEPAAPVPFMMVGMGAMSAPQEVPEQLGISVTANE
ncbi:MAG: hypothetical protein M9939_00450 [Mesorhizobium sp.]|nr:hypothetical protein [Mesorhizobium sp.]MCO5159577.1 hypothetical protein [Mesorhizobium sp.]